MNQQNVDPWEAICHSSFIHFVVDFLFLSYFNEDWNKKCFSSFDEGKKRGREREKAQKKMLIEIAVEKMDKLWAEMKSRSWNFNAMSTFYFSITRWNRELETHLRALCTHTHTHSLTHSYMSCVGYIIPIIESCVWKKKAAVAAIVLTAKQQTCGESDYAAGIKGAHTEKLLYYRLTSVADQLSKKATTTTK